MRQRSSKPAGALCAVFVAAAVACGGESKAPAPAASAPGGTAVSKSAAAAPPASSAPGATQARRSRLPEDPIAGKRSEQQWREHQAHEEVERQVAFDHGRLRQHRAVVRLIGAARARYDRARTEAAVTLIQRTIGARTAELRRRVKALDPWGVNSPLLPDYEALATSLEGVYADARIAAIRGDARTLEGARADFEERLKKIADWLAKVEREGDGEYEHEHEREHERADRESSGSDVSRGR